MMNIRILLASGALIATLGLAACNKTDPANANTADANIAMDDTGNAAANDTGAANDMMDTNDVDADQHGVDTHN